MKRKFDAAARQRKPRGRGADVSTLVKRDIERRVTVGARKYGERLRTHNGRSAILDAYQGAFDLVLYLGQHIEESRRGKR